MRRKHYLLVTLRYIPRRAGCHCVVHESRRPEPRSDSRSHLIERVMGDRIVACEIHRGEWAHTEPQCAARRGVHLLRAAQTLFLSLIHISEPTRRTPISYAVFCLKKKKK